MRQDDYEVLSSCIQYGAPALAPRLMQALNSEIENSNKFLEVKRAQAEQERKKTITNIQASASKSIDAAADMKPSVPSKKKNVEE